ncbi:MAG: AgmX/PglI C-terminal domain-containing protein [Myxococcota bacterium]
MARTSLVGGLALFASCGGAPPSDSEHASNSEGSDEGQLPPEEAEDGLQIQGLMGTLSAMEIRRGLDPRMPRFIQCFQQRYDELEMLGGEVNLSFRVAVNGSVRWVYPSASTIGDRETERCLLSVAEGTRFPEPHGGEAEFSWPLAIDPPEDVRPPFNWDATRVESVVSQNASGVRGCGGGTFTVTAYVAPGGRVVAAGAASGDADSAAALDCVASEVTGWAMPDPGSYPAKVTFDVR